MAKLDKQGLNTFIRELDKHINTKINRLDISPKADKVMMQDGTSVEETVSANKTSILSIKNLENEEVEVRKIETEENFIAVEDTKNGYFTDIKLEGKTLVVNENNEVVEAGTSGATIKSVGQNVSEMSVLSCNENLFDINNITKNQSMGGDADNLGATSDSIYTHITNYIPVIANKTYTFNYTFEKLSNEAKRAYVFYDENKNIITSYTNSSYDPTIKEHKLLSKTNGYLRIAYDVNCMNITISITQDKKRILYYNSDTKAWEKPVLRKWDTIEKHSDGKYYYHKRSGEVTLNGSEDWELISLNDGRKYAATSIILSLAKPTSSDFICDKYPSVYMNSVYDGGYGVYIDSLGRFRILNDISISSSTTSSTFKTWLQSNNVTAVYQLAEEKVYECTNLDLISYQDETNYIASTGAITPKSSFNVTGDIANVVKLLQQRTTSGETHEHEYQKYALTTPNGRCLDSITTDLDEHTMSGFYSVQRNTPNAPGTGYWFLEIYGNGWYVKQVATAYSSTTSTTYIRTKNKSGWNPWEKLTSTATTSLLEQQISELETQSLENENKISILNAENIELRKELNQIQTSIASLIATTIEK